MKIKAQNMEIEAQGQFNIGYEFAEEEIREVLSPEYIEFLKEAGYVDLDKTPNLFVAAKLLRMDDKVRDACNASGIITDIYSPNQEVNYINWEQGRKLINHLGGKLLTEALMYQLIIPSLKKESNSQAKKTLYEMVEKCAELMEDEIFNRRKLKIGKSYRNLEQLPRSGYFDSSDLNEFGYPKVTKESGEFCLYNDLGLERVAVVRIWGPELSLFLNWSPTYMDSKLGIRFAKFF